jgi:hypothetical protein
MRWGNWVFDPNNLTLTHSAEHYEIDLETIHSSAAILEWIFQIQRKVWATAQTLHDLLRAFRDILDPQANYCSFEEDIRSDGGTLARQFAQRLCRRANGEVV